MKRVFSSLLMVTMALVTLGLAVTQARADRITLNSGCLGVSCNADPLKVSSVSLSLGTSSIKLDVATVDSAQLEFVSNAVGDSDFGIASATAQNAAKVSVEQLNALKNSTRPRPTELALLGDSMLWSFSGAHSAMYPNQFTLPVSNGRGGSFSVSAANVVSTPSIAAASVKKGTTFQANGVGSSSADAAPGIVGGPVVPEPTTMLLFGTGLVGAAAVLRKRLRGRREESK